MSYEEEKEIAVLSAELKRRIEAVEPSKRKRVLKGVIMAALGSVPWVGSVLAAAASYKNEETQIETDRFQMEWIAEHEQKWKGLARDIVEIVARLDSFGEEVVERLQSEEYLALVRKAFRVWDAADTDEKRQYVCRLITNAGGTTFRPDDLIRLFLDWLDRYHEAHFTVIREIYRHPGVSRYGIWKNIHGQFPADSSSEADLFRLLIGDLSLGRVIRQHRRVDSQGRFRARKRTRAKSGGLMKSAFDREEPYELTELGKEFVHYVFQEAVPRIGNGS